jgi:hypothetical protein
VAIATAIVAASGLLALPPPPVQAASDLLPDLRMQPLNPVRITVEGGRRRLRFTAIMSNWGSGAFEMRATRPGASAGWSVQQRIYDDEGGSRLAPTPTTLQYAGDGHNHWHVRDMNYYDLWGPSGTRREAKVGFCFLDTTPVALSLPGARQSSFYREEECDGAATTSITAGISVGWGDNYPWHFAYQWVDITGIAPGVYTLRSIVDPLNHFVESNENNNCAWVRLSIPASGNPTVQASGLTCTDDVAGTPFAREIGWLYDEGLTTGCRVMLFCTTDDVSRGQMAAFLARALELPPADADYFTDDQGSIYENDINRLARAGITSGCAANRYCPGDPVRRDQMASFLVRAADLPPTNTNYFSDDTGNVHEKNINALAASGVTTGCGAGVFCPTALVTRGQLAAFLYRAFR